MTTAVFPSIPRQIPAQTADEIGRAPVFDHAGQAFVLTDGAVRECAGRDAVRQWIALMLRQKPGKTPIYCMDSALPIGIDRSLPGQRLPGGFMQAELARQIRQTLACCPAIRTADDFCFVRTGRGLTVSFRTYLRTGEQLEVSEYVSVE